MKTEIIEGNKLITEFMGEKIKVSDANGFQYVKGAMYPQELSYHSSWDWQIPVWGKIALAVKTLIPKLKNAETNAKWYFGLVTKYENAVYRNEPEAGQEIIIELLKWYNQNNNQ